MAVAVEVTRSDRFPTWPGSGAHQLIADLCWPVQFPRSRRFLWPVFVFCHKMSEWPSSLKSPVPTTFQSGPGAAPTS